ncbi:hypothetical protein ACFLYY_01890 [Patescibacteria group bacterium]
MSWLLVTILAYFVLAIVVLVDKYLLTSSIQNPKVYAFYVGFLFGLAVILIPFIGFFVPSNSQIILSLLAGATFVMALYWLYKGLNLFEASRIIPAIGGLVPLFTFGLIYIISGGQEKLSLFGFLAFILLVSGSFLINFEKEKPITSKSLKLSLITAFLFSLSFVLIKYVYLAQPFWNGFIWRSIGGFLTAACFFIIFPEIKKEIFKKREKSSLKTSIIFLSNQAMGSVGTILQNWAIALAPLAFVAIINALQGIQYAFLLIITVFLSLKFPQILKEEISKNVIFQKIFSILIIGAGLILLVL